MQPVMSVSAVREFEEALAEKGVKPQELMRRAGAVVALQAARLVEGGGVVVLCGMGNNGGDGWVAADNLARHGYEVNVVSAAPPAVMKSELARRMASRVAEIGIPIHVDPGYDELAALLSHADVVVDAVFGTGFRGTMPSPYDGWVRAVDDVFTGALVAVDVPSGINATTGMSEGPYFEADVTVTMFAVKPGLISGEGRRASGVVMVAGLVTDDEGLSDLSDVATAFTLTDRDYYEALPAADPLQDKYSRGTVVVVAGSSRYPGAAIMAAKAAARAGAGYVTLVVPEPVVPVAQAHLLTVPVVGLAADGDGSFAAASADRIGALVEKADVVLAGPGLTTSFGACEVVRQLLEAPVALVLDADGLNAAVKMCTGSAEEHPAPLRREHPLVLTPHRGELARLIGAERSATASLAEAADAAQNIAWAVGSGDFCVVAKGPVTAVAAIEGTLIPQPGPAALATAGSGDVLGGIVAGTLARAVAQLEPGETLDCSDLLLLMAAADRVHALAGQMAVERWGSGVVASDLIDLVGLAVDGLNAAAERAVEEADDEGVEDSVAYEDEDHIAPPPEVERLIRSDAAARAVKLPGELKGYEGDLEEPEPESAPEAEAAPEATGPAAEKDPAVTAERVPAVEAKGTSPEARPAAAAEPEAAAGPEAELQAEPEVALQAKPELEPEVVDDESLEVAAETVKAEVVAVEAQAGEAGVGQGSEQQLKTPVESAVPKTTSEPTAPAAAAAPVVPDFLKAQMAAVETVDPDATRVMMPVSATAPQAEAAAPRQTAASQAAATSQPLAADGSGSPVPPFLANAVKVAAQVAPAADEAEGEPVRELSPQELERQRIAEFHERATLHIDDDAVTPVDKRPRAKSRARRR